MSRQLKFDQRTIIEYPNATHFAFIPAIIKISGIPADYSSVEVELVDDQTRKQNNEVREPFGGEVRFDICRYLQILFDGVRHGVVKYNEAFVDSPLKRTATITLRWYNGSVGQTLLTFKVDAIWGGQTARESSGGVINRRWFVNYPFTFDLFARYGETLDVRIDGKSDQGVEFVDHTPDATGASVYRRRLVNPARLLETSQIEHSVHIAAPHSLVLRGDTEKTGLTAYTLDVDRSSSGVYLRWIDKQGRYCYYLFQMLGTAAATTIAASWERNAMVVPTVYVDGLSIESPTQQSLATKPTISLGAKLADWSTFNFLLTATSSPVVDVFDGYDETQTPMWHRVNVVAGNYAKTTKSYQDFSMTIEQPIQISQTL